MDLIGSRNHTITTKPQLFDDDNNDNDDKLVVMQEGKNYTDDQIRALTEFQEQWFESIIIRK